MAELGEVVGILSALVGWFEGFVGLHVHSEVGGEFGVRIKDVFRVITLDSFPNNVVNAVVKMKHLSLGCILYTPSEGDILDPRMGSLGQLGKLDVPQPHSQDLGFCHFFLGNPMGIGLRGHTEGHIYWRFTERGPHSRSKTWRHFKRLGETYLTSV